MQLNCDQWDRSRSFSLLLSPSCWLECGQNGRSSSRHPGPWGRKHWLQMMLEGPKGRAWCGDALPPLISCICMREKAMSAVLNINVLMCEVLLCNFRMSVTAQSNPTKWASVGPHRWGNWYDICLRTAFFLKDLRGEKSNFPFSSFPKANLINFFPGIPWWLSG